MAAPTGPSIDGRSVEHAASGDAHLRALQAELDQLLERRGDFDAGTFAVIAWAAGFALTQALERAWRARGVPEPEMNCRFLSIERRRQGARPDA